ncbi:mitochondrial thiamine pyrophosphate carrier-like isoform X1 [Leguminivora glycinivorella]|uniref:mitochondrial thiamine pyrophosphate carrier-like isoform X1 n=1 Tax=Leguminivora glycinivorella TaxID=1035111 RepID=UPI00200C99C5|nr:mitochondrial thiamine pyrophosphate carrier-like isoform X1 [Leguminivora glycinivorella]
MVVGFRKDETLTPNQKLIAGVISGITTRFITQPLDIVKVRTQLQPKNKGRTWLSLSWRILKEEGFTTFWHGHSLGQLHSILSVASQFHAYEISTKFVENYAAPYTSPKVKKVLLFMCGIFAGCASATLVSPIEVIRVRQMVVKAQYGGMLQGAREVYRRGGFLAFYEGLTASVLQMGPQVGITFAVFRFVQPLVMDYMAYIESPETEAEKKAAQRKHILIASSIAGSTAGFVSKTATYPFDLAKRRLQIAVEPRGGPHSEDALDDEETHQMQNAHQLPGRHDPQERHLGHVHWLDHHNMQGTSDERLNFHYIRNGLLWYEIEGKYYAVGDGNATAMQRSATRSNLPSLWKCPRWAMSMDYGCGAMRRDSGGRTFVERQAAALHNFIHM